MVMNMVSVELDEKTLGELADLARARDIELSVLASEAIRAYLRAEAQRAMQEEATAFRQLHPRLLETIPNEYAAIHSGELVDHDQDLVALYERIVKRFGNLPVLMRQVRSEPEQLILIRSPRIEYE